MGLFSFLFGSNSIFGRRFVSPVMQERIQSDWKSIDSLLRGGTPSQMRQGLITADKTLDSAMKDVFSGETMAERLKNASTRFDKPFYDKIWKAHKMRNSLVHEAGYEPTYEMLKTSIEILRQAVVLLGVRV